MCSPETVANYTDEVGRTEIQVTLRRVGALLRSGISAQQWVSSRWISN